MCEYKICEKPHSRHSIRYTSTQKHKQPSLLGCLLCFSHYFHTSVFLMSMFDQHRFIIHYLTDHIFITPDGIWARELENIIHCPTLKGNTSKRLVNRAIPESLIMTTICRYTMSSTLINRSSTNVRTTGIIRLQQRCALYCIYQPLTRRTLQTTDGLIYQITLLVHNPLQYFKLRIYSLTCSESEQVYGMLRFIFVFNYFKSIDIVNNNSGEVFGILFSYLNFILNFWNKSNSLWR